MVMYLLRNKGGALQMPPGSGEISSPETTSAGAGRGSLEAEQWYTGSSSAFWYGFDRSMAQNPRYPKIYKFTK